MHPQIIGRGHRIRMLDDIVAEMKRHDVVFSTLLDAAREWRAEQVSVPDRSLDVGFTVDLAADEAAGATDQRGLHGQDR